MLADLSGVRSWEQARASAELEYLGADTAALRVRLTTVPGWCSGRVVAQANAIANGRRVRVQVIAAGYAQAGADLVSRLRSRVLEVISPWQARPWPEPPGTASPVALGTHRASSDTGKIVRIKLVEPVWCAPDAAIATMDALDYRAHLFTDPECEMDALVDRAGPTGYRLTRLRPAPPPGRSKAPTTLDLRPSPLLTASDAMANLDRTGLTHLFFADPATGHGRLLYRRFDGNYALITRTL
jgi:hypothetical protein